jgi:hypothetical protein
MATPDDMSLAACIRLRMPCLNMSAAGITVDPNATIDSEDAKHWMSASYYTLVILGSGSSKTNTPSNAMPVQVWAKVHLVNKILRTGHHVHFSDVDVVFLRDIWSSYHHLFSQAGEVFWK